MKYITHLKLIHDTEHVLIRIYLNNRGGDREIATEKERER